AAAVDRGAVDRAARGGRIAARAADRRGCGTRGGDPPDREHRPPARRGGLRRGPGDDRAGGRAGVACLRQLLLDGRVWRTGLAWAAAMRVFVDAVDRPRPATWMLLGLILGLGLLNKISVLWLGAGLAAAIVLTPARRQLRTPGPYLAAAIAAALFLPHVLWQI